MLHLHFYFLIAVTAFYWIQTLNLFGDLSLLNRILTGLSGLFQTLNLLNRWFSSGTFPLSNLYESLLFLSWALTSFLIVVHFNLPWLTSRVDQFVYRYCIEKVSANKLPFILNKTAMQLPKNNWIVVANPNPRSYPRGYDDKDPALYDDFLGSVLMPMVLLVNMFIFFLPDGFKSDYNLVPALQSNWLQMHVVVMISAYAALLLGCLLSMAYLVLSLFFIKTDLGTGDDDYRDDQHVNPYDPLNQDKTHANKAQAHRAHDDFLGYGLGYDSLNSTGSTVALSQGAEPAYPGNSQLNSNKAIEKSPGHTAKPQTYEQKKHVQRQKQLKKLAQMWDNYSYRSIGLGFPLLTMGLLSGAVWANQTWGSYWSWDPKETWALITWFVFAIYLHTRLSKGWSGRKSAWLALFGFITLWICYLGVNLMAKGLHSYGFLR